MILGTQVRESIDVVKMGMSLTDRSLWIGAVRITANSQKFLAAFNYHNRVAFYRVYRFSKNLTGRRTVAQKGLFCLAMPFYWVMTRYDCRPSMVGYARGFTGASFSRWLTIVLIFIFVLILSQRTKVFEKLFIKVFTH